VLLKQLVEYSHRAKSQPALYAEVPIRYIVELDENGILLSPKPIDTADPSNRLTARGQRRLAPQVQRGNRFIPMLFADRAEYTLGITSKSLKPQRAKKVHTAYLEMLEKCLAQTGLPQVLAVHRFLIADPLSAIRLEKTFDPSANITFRVGGVFPMDLPEVQRFWAEQHSPASRFGCCATRQCLVCGEKRPALIRLQQRIKGIPNGQSQGTVLISANDSAYASYGLKASSVSPICEECGQRSTRAMNLLLEDPNTHHEMGDTVFVFWTRNSTEKFSFHDFLFSPRPEQVKRLIKSAGNGNQPSEIDNDSFYCVALSANGGRTVVRDWIDSTLAQIRFNLARWFERQAIVGPFGERPRPLGINLLAKALERGDGGGLNRTGPLIKRALFRAALTGAPLPSRLLYLAVRRNCAERNVSHARAAVTKLAIYSTKTGKHAEDYMQTIELENNSVAYLCGRLLALFERAQRLAGRPNATIVDRFYGAASSTPRMAYPLLARLARAHLSKLSFGARASLESSIEEIVSRIGSFPAVFNLEEQGMFSLGYYHQRAHDRFQKTAGKKDHTNEDAIAA